MIKLSIIIPVFNTEQYLEYCLNSCLQQDLSATEYEIIVIDDGSTDNSNSILSDYANKYSNIIHMSKKNEGVSATRNLGISIANGNYITFVDSDDKIKENSLNEILQKVESKSLDCLILNSVLYKDGLRIKEAYKYPNLTSKESISGVDLFKTGYSRGSVCGVIFSRKFLINNNLKFPVQVINGEDAFFMSLIFAHAKSMDHFDIDFYLVSVRSDSSSRTWNYNKVKYMFKNLAVIENYINNHTLNKEQLSILGVQSYAVISNAIYYFVKIRKFKKYFDLKHEINSSSLYPIKSYDSNKFKYKILLLNFSVDIYVAMVIIKNLFSKIFKY